MGILWTKRRCEGGEGDEADLGDRRLGEGRARHSPEQERPDIAGSHRQEDRGGPAEFKQKVCENQHDLVVNESGLGAGILPKTLVELAPDLPQDPDAIRYTLAELTGQDAVRELIRSKAEGHFEQDSEGGQTYFGVLANGR